MNRLFLFLLETRKNIKPPVFCPIPTSKRRHIIISRNTIYKKKLFILIRLKIPTDKNISIIIDEFSDKYMEKLTETRTNFSKKINSNKLVGNISL